uniref:RNA helicase n=1 Tax=Phallusia mammillata TaxID=59560 RepID=A0A6F9DBD6_9ASCI|nr:probable ATP-dependent RNA helicase DDX49 [Phallusia mammillata]
MEVEGNFEDLGLNQWILDHLNHLGFRRPSPVQFNCIPPALQGRDCFGCSKTGSGKTAAFALPVLQKLSEDPYGVFCLVLTPTRELAYQIADQFALLGKPINLQHTVVVGGMDTLQQAAALKKRPHVVIATPGRLADLLRSSEGNVNLKKIKFLVLDEADRLLDKLDGDFSEDLDVIFEALPKERQTLLYSATLTDTLNELQELSTKKPFFWEAEKTVSTVDQLDQRYILLPEHVKDGYLVYICKDLMEKSPNHSIMIFTKTCRNCHVLGMLLQKAGFDCVVLHSGMKQRQRLSALARFKSSNIRLLVATDVAARGLDIPLVQVVINHNIPGLAKNYIHRVGRTARAGRSGMAISLVTQFDIHRVQSIEEHINTKLKEYDVDEDEVLRILTKVNIMKREAEQRMDNDKFGEKKRTNKRKALIMEGKNPEAEAKRKRNERIARIKAERKERNQLKKAQVPETK